MHLYKLQKDVNFIECYSLKTSPHAQEIVDCNVVD
jgi:hypothetical protein